MLRLDRYQSFCLGCLVYFILLMAVVVCCSCCSGTLLPQAQHPDIAPTPAKELRDFSRYTFVYQI